MVYSIPLTVRMAQLTLVNHVQSRGRSLVAALQCAGTRL